MSVERISGSRPLSCPLCGAQVGAAGCATCHLSRQEILRHRTRERAGSGSWGRRTWTRLIGLVAYGGIGAWSWIFMPSVFLFVLPAAIVGAYMQVVRLRPVLGAALFVAIVAVVPALLWPAGLTGVVSDLTRDL